MPAGPLRTGAFGTLRLSLAMLVAIAHYDVLIGGLMQGVSAVVVFTIVSGYAMSGLLARGVPPGPGRVWRFLRDRALRLLPQYDLWLAVAWMAMRAGVDLGPSVSGRAGWAVVLANLTIVPLDFYMAFPAIARFTILPPAWSLGLEMLFYAALPALRAARARWVAAGLSLAIALLAALGVVDADIYGYRLLPGTLCYFLLGAAIHDRDARLGLTILAGLSACAAGAIISGHLRTAWNTELLIGWSVGAPLVFALSRIRPARWDGLLGRAAYGCYLAHWLPERLLIRHQGEPAWAIGIAILSGVLGAFGYWSVERPIERLRRGLRVARPDRRRVSGRA